MAVKLHLRAKAEAVSWKEFDGFFHPFSHWILVVFASLLTGIIFNLVGFLLVSSGLLFFQTEFGWLQLVFGLPLILAGASMVLINLYQILASVLDRRYSQSHCFFCRNRKNLTGRPPNVKVNP